MSAHSFSPFPPLGAPGAAIGRLRGQFTPLLLIAAAHALVLYGVYSGMLHRVVQHAMSEEVVVRLVQVPPPEPPPEPVPLADIQTLPPPDIPVPETIVTVASLAPAPAVTSAAPLPAGAEPAAPGMATAASGSAVPALAQAATPRTLTAGVEYIKAPEPEYPAASRLNGEQGRVVLRILVSDKGLPEQVVVQSSSGFPRLDEAARQAALRALFKPHLEDGRPAAVYVIVPLNFHLS